MEVTSNSENPQTFGPPSKKCLHCGNPVPTQTLSQFCCLGCETVYHWIHDQQLQKFYELKTKIKPLRKANSIPEKKENLRYLDDPEFLENYSWKTPEGQWMEFYVEGVHCAACVWLTEKIVDIVDHVGSIQLNLGNSIATVRITEGGSFAAVAAEFQKMGYRPHPIQKGQHLALQKRENRLFLARLGVAGTSAGNIMLLAISLYGGADGTMADRFRWISLGLFLPVLLFSAVPFYQSAWSALRAKQISIDIPVVFGVLLGSCVSIFNLFSGDERIYFDSLATLIFLLLSTRFFLKRTQQNALNASRLLHFLTPSTTRKWNPTLQGYEEVKLDEITTGDRVQILPSECLGVDGVVRKGTSSLDVSLLSGESKPQEVKIGDILFAGTTNLDAPLEIEVTQAGSRTRVGRILESMEQLLQKKAPIALFTDRMARYFVSAVVLISGIVFVAYFPTDWIEGMNRALAISIVTCPCTFALITPLAFSLSLGKLARKGILVKGPEVLEKLTQIQTLFFDKTGTLTFGSPYVTLWDVPIELKKEILAMEQLSLHPVAKAIVRYLKPQVEPPLPTPEDVHETLGLGITGCFAGVKIEIKRATQGKQGTELDVFRNGQKVGTVILEDQVRPDSKSTLQKIRTLGLTPRLLSGDLPGPVFQIAQAVGIPQQDCFAETSPEQKSKMIKDQSPALMVGDGANDAMALAQAHVGVAVQSGVEISLRAADVYITNPGVTPIYDLLVIAHETIRVVKRNLALSIVYNLIAAGFALAGKINPLMAAVLMPASALTVFISSVAGTSQMKKVLRGIPS